MKINYFIAAGLLFVFMVSNAMQGNAQKIKDKAAYVDPFVCSSGDHGQLTPSASLPFGLVKLGPQTASPGQAGYDYSDEHISGFTINRLEGVGCKGAGGNILVKPGMGDTSLLSYRCDKTSEKASPGYYTVKFIKPAIKAELTVTNATGWHRFTFNNNGKAWIMIDLSRSLDSLVEERHQVKRNRINGSIKALSVCKLGVYQFFYTLTVSKNPDAIRNKGSVIWYFFRVKKGETIDVKTSISSIGTVDAQRIMAKETGDINFNAIRNKARALWNKKLDKITVKGKGEYVKLFYTHYYHTLLSPFKLGSYSGEYRGSDGKLHNAGGYQYYHGWSLWDNFRTEMPLLTITEPGVMNDICKSLVALYSQGKNSWATQTEPFPTVRTEHAIIVLLDCYRKGINKYNLAAVYPFLKKETEHYPVSSPDQKLETAYDYWALSEIAGLLNKKQEAEQFAMEAARYRNIWREKFLTMDDQSDIVGGNGLYEGTLWQYRWFVPFDYSGVISMMGSDAFLKQLTYFFDHHLYNPANEPDIGVPYLFNLSGKPYLTQRIVNQILTKPMRDDYATHTKFKTPYNGSIYRLDPQGYVPEMDDDAGTMAAWYVLSSMGLYPICVGEPVYALTAPILSSVTLRLPGNKTFKITTRNISDKNFYIQKAFLNGKILERCWITHQELIKGGVLRFILGDKPNKEWGITNQWITKLNVHEK